MPSNHLMLCLLPSIFLASGSFPVSQFFASDGQIIGASASASVLPMNIQDWFPLGWTGWIFLQFKGLSRVFSNTTAQKHQFFGAQLSLWSNSHIHTCYGYRNVIHCLSGQYNNTILLYGQLYILLALIITVCLLSFPCTYHRFFSNLWLNNKFLLFICSYCTYFNMYKLINSLFLFFPPIKDFSPTPFPFCSI